jgi:hypothetical protein
LADAAIVGKWAEGNKYLLRLARGRLALDLSSDVTEATRMTILGNTVIPGNWYADPGAWTHVAARRRGETVTLYVNGEADGSGMFAGAVYSGAAPLRIGVVEPSAGPYYTGGIDELSISVTEPPPPTTHASIYIPADFDPEVADTIHYFHGLRDAMVADPAFSESETAPSSLLFRGTFAGVDTTIAVDAGTFNRLTPGVDTFTAVIAHRYADGAVATLQGPFTETGPATGVFRATLSIDEMPARTVVENIHVACNPGPGTADSIQYYTGLREPAPGDWTYREYQGAEASMQFYNTCVDAPAGRITITNFAGLTPQVDEMDVNWAIENKSGFSTVRQGHLIETGPTSNVFRAVFHFPRHLASLSRNVEVLNVRHGTYRPFTTRMKGLPSGVAYTMSIGGAGFSVVERDGWYRSG